MITFKQIELVGFKSFADKTVIPLTDGVTCIVGPNGCGKSNVADAIRWVLGEQSAKVMRGSQMMDVIFGGTEKRRKMSFCEVTLTFDNTRRVFDIDCDEVEMTRRLYRDGESEYLLNRQPSRMKVLTGLLHGAGAAKEGYSIIGQGRIEQIMNARPEDRRSIFEEATGIVVFKDRKAEAERRLEAAKNNLFVFLQRMQEKERRLGPLKKAAETALKYRELYGELRRREMNLYIYRHDTAESARERINVKMGDARRELDQIAETSQRLLKEYGDFRDELNSSDGKLRELNERLRRYEVNIEHKSGETRLYTERARSAKQQLSSAQDEIAYSSKRIDEIDKELRRTENIAGKNRDRIVGLQADAEKLQAEIGTLSEQIAKYEYMTSEHRKKVMDTFKDLSDMRQNIGSLSARQDLIRERLSEIDGDMEKIRARRDRDRAEYEKSIARAEEINAFLGNEGEICEQAENALRECEHRIELLVKQVYDTEAQISSLSSTLDTYKALRDRFEGYTYSVRKLMSDSRNDTELSSKIQGLIADLVSCDKQFEIAIETAFGGAMQNVVTGTREDARYLIEYLKRTRSGQVTFLPIEALKPRYESDQIKFAVRDSGAIGLAIDLVKYDKKFDGVIRYLLGNTLICDDIASATVIARRYPRAFKIVTLDGDVIATSGSMTGGSKREVAGNLLANERRIKEVEEQIEAKRAFLARADEKRAALDIEKRAAAENLDALHEKSQALRLELAAAAEKQSSLLQAVTGAESEYAAYNQSKKVLADRLAGLDSEFSGVSSSEKDLMEQSGAASTAIDDMSAEYDKLVSLRNAKTGKLNSYNVEIASLESSVKAGEDGVERLKNEKVTLLEKIDTIRASIPEIEKQLNLLNSEAERSALTAEEQKVVENIRRDIAAVTQSKGELNDKIRQNDVDRTLLQEKSEDCKNKIFGFEKELQKIDSDLDYSRQRIEEEYGVGYEECLQYKEEDFDVSLASSQIINYKRQISMLGAINHNAVEEYDELNAEYEKDIIERDDLTKGIEDLTGALDDIRAEMQKIFDEGFKTINENFKRTFRELFGGGKAELQLDYTDCDDPLDAGVEIIACPPGKKLTKISLLSGGERALTAIAILFAIIGMRPMPFCVLDEIEAALDEANVARYARYLKKFAENTQFIVITHRKPTMESSDTLFGVTMEEQGVSKIVSVKLSEVETRLGGDTVM